MKNKPIVHKMCFNGENFHAHWKDVEYENYQNKGISKGLKQTMAKISLILDVNMEHN
jgi:hypothetical protein